MEVDWKIRFWLLTMATFLVFGLVECFVPVTELPDRAANSTVGPPGKEGSDITVSDWPNADKVYTSRPYSGIKGFAGICAGIMGCVTFGVWWYVLMIARSQSAAKAAFVSVPITFLTMWFILWWLCGENNFFMGQTIACYRFDLSDRPWVIAITLIILYIIVKVIMRIQAKKRGC